MHTPSTQLDTLSQGIQEAESAFLSLASVSSDAVVVADSRGCVAMLNPRAEQLIGISPLDAIGHPICEILPLDEQHALPDFDAQRPDAMWPAALLLKPRGKPATQVSVHTKSLGMTSAAHAGWLLYVLSEPPATAPGDTSLESFDFKNRADFMSALDSAIADAQRTETEYALFFMTADQTEAMNRVAGMEASERFRMRLARVLQLLKSSTSLAGQLDHRAFALLVRDQHLRDAQGLARVLHEALRTAASTERDTTEAATVSIGIAPITATALDADSALSEAATACRRAYEDGGNRTAIASSDSSGLMRRRDEIRWMAVLSAALDADRPCLQVHRLLAVSQTDAAPHYDLELHVLDDQTQEPLPTDRLLAAATQFGLRTSVDRFVLGTALPQIVTATTAGTVEPNSVFIIPLSEESMRDPAMLAFLRRRIHDCGFAPERLVFRVCEPSVASHTANAIRLLNGIRQMGSKVMIECVGGLNSSFANLKNLPADYLALEASLAASASVHRTDRAMVEAIKQWAVVLGIKSVACGVDTDDALHTAREIGIDWVRGKVAGEPRNVSAMNGW